MDLQIKQLAFKQLEKVFHHRIVQASAFAAHILPDALFAEHTLVLLMLVLPALVRVKDQIRSIWYCFKSIVQHSSYYVQDRPVRDRIAYQIAVVQIQDR